MVTLALLLAACGDDAVTPPPPEAPASAPAPTASALLRDGDQRRLTEELRRGLSASSPDLRRVAARSVAALRAPPDTVLLLRRALRDTDPRVRAEAFEGLAVLGESVPSEPLVGALTAEPDPGARARMLRALGQHPDTRAFAAMVPALRSDAASDREAACLAAGERALAGQSVTGPTRSRMAAMLAPPEPVEVRLACAYALARLPPTRPGEAPGLAVALGLAAADSDEEVRAYAYRALGRIADTDLAVLVQGTEDPSWRVQVNAFRALGTLAAQRDAGPAVYARALNGAFERLRDPGVRPGGPLHVFLTAAGAAGPFSRATPIHDLAASLHRDLDRPDEATRDDGLAHCAAAQLVDRSRGWPSRVESCGLDRVSEDERAVLEADVLGALDGADAQRLARLRRLFDRETPRVREATVSAAASIVSPDSVELVLAGLGVDDPGVRAASLDALIQVAGWRPSEQSVPPPLPDERVRAALLQLREQAADDELETLVTWIRAVSTLDARELADAVTRLGLHPNHAVRSDARALLARWEVALPAGAYPGPGETPSEVPDPQARPRVALETDRGEVVLELRPDLAPFTVQRFLGLVNDGFYDGLTFHRVVPAFVVQGGDPRGDGYGGPGWAQRCETSHARYARGTVGMALAGRDTGGSQFFITHGRQPHLEGRYPVFATVVTGMDQVDQLQAGDRIVRASVHSD